MHDYTQVKKKYGSFVSQTLDQPIMILDTWEIQDALAALSILFMGVIFSSFLFVLVGLSVTLVILPILKKKFPKGIVFHFLYRAWGVELPGLINPKAKQGQMKKYSD